MYKLLIVDDEAIEREALKYIVKNSKLRISEVREASNGQEAVEIAAEFKPDIVTLDIKMPGLNGIEAGRIIRDGNPETKIIFLTAYDSFEYAHEAIKIGVEEFIIKPGSNEKTIEILQSCIEQLDLGLIKKQQREKLEVKINQISGYLENEFVNSVVNGEIDEQQAADYLKFMLNEFVEGFGVVIELDFLENSDMSLINRNMIKKRFAQHLSALLNQNMRFMLNQMKKTIYILVFGYPTNMRNHYMRLIEDEIQIAGDDFNGQLDTRLYYGFGGAYEQISMLWKSFAQAKAALRNMQLCYMENADGGEPAKNSLEFTENELWLSILNEREEDVIRKADHVVDNIIFIYDDINEVRLKLYEFFTLMNRYLNKESQLKHAVPDDLFDNLKNIVSRSEAKNYIHFYLFEILEELKEQRKNKTPELLDKAVLFIHENFRENLTLDEVAYEVGFSTYYFGKIFKKTFEVTFTEYLANFRIAQAKALMKDPLLSVKDITYRVGYMDPNYFTRVFKKSEGLTPTEYRNQILFT